MAAANDELRISINGEARTVARGSTVADLVVTLGLQPQQVAVGLQQRRATAAQKSRLYLAHEAGEQRRQQQHQRHLRSLHGEIADERHMASTSSRITSTMNTRLR